MPSRLQEQNQQLRSAVENYNLLLAGSGIGVYEWRSVRDLRSPLFWSPKMYSLLGIQPGSVEPTMEMFLSLVHPDDVSHVQAGSQMALPTPETVPMDYRLLVKGLYRWFRERRVTRLASDGTVQMIIGTLEEIHSQKVAEEKIRSMNSSLEAEISRRTVQLEIASKAKTRFLANMSHEMRTPLGLILGFSDLLKENQSLDNEAREYVKLISKNGEILSRVINDLLDLSKIEAGKLRFQYSRVSLLKLMEELKEAFQEKASQKGLKLSFDYLCSPSEMVVTDEIRLKQIVYNLISNALKFTDRGGIHVILGQRPQHYFIDVMDSGTGIPEQEKENIFQEYVRGEMADSGRTTGTGLGLRLAQNLSLALGGRVELVSSQLGKGSHFRVTFLSDEHKLQQQAERRQEVMTSSRLTDLEIFVLDDNEDNIRLAEIFLRKLGCRVRGFVSARSLFAELASVEPALILLDINMPEMSGFEVFDRLRQMGYQKPIWALTAYGLNEDIQAILKHGFDDFIRKPISIDHMKRKLTFELKEKVHD